MAWVFIKVFVVSIAFVYRQGAVRIGKITITLRRCKDVYLGSKSHKSPHRVIVSHQHVGAAMTAFVGI